MLVQGLPAVGQTSIVFGEVILVDMGNMDSPIGSEST